MVCSSALPGHSAHREPSELSRPSHHLMATWKTGDPCEAPSSQRAQRKASMQHEGRGGGEETMKAWSSNLLERDLRLVK